MAAHDFLPITHDEIPVEKVFTLDGKNYAVEFNYNDIGDFYTISIRDESTGDLLFTTKLTYLSKAIDAVIDGITMTHNIVPALPLDLDSNTNSDIEVTQENFDEVYLCLR